MKQNATVFLILILGVWGARAGTESMPGMPQIQSKSYLIQDPQALSDSAGFGDKEPEVKMQNLMMVEGSGYEGMEMDMTQKTAPRAAPRAAPTHAHTQGATYEIEILGAPATYKIGANTIRFSAKRKGERSPVTKLLIKAEVSMVTMDMGVDAAGVKETAPGVYEVKVIPSMAGTWALKLIFPNREEKTLNLEVQKR